MNTFFIAMLSIVLSVAAQFALKTGISNPELKAILVTPYSLRTVLTILTDKFVLLGFLLYGLGALIWLGVLIKWDVSKAYPLVGLGFVLTVLVGIVLGEQVTLIRVIGVLTISLGVWLVANS